MSITIHAVASPGEVRVAVACGGALLDFALWRPGAPDGVGDLHRGRVAAVVPAMAGAFVALADAEGFLPDSEGAKGLTVGTILGVRIMRAAQAGKGPRLTARLTPAEADRAATGPLGLLHRGPDPVTRMATRYPSAPVLASDAALAATLRVTLGRLTLGERVAKGPASFDEDVATAIESLFQPVVQLSGGASLSIWPTPALVAIDVDTGSRVAASGGRRMVHEAVNRAVLPALAAQIRLRDLSGAIVVDLAGLSVRKRSQLGPDLARVLADDPLRPKFLGFTALGLAEIVRVRVHPPVHELMSGPLAAGLAALRAAVAAVGADLGSTPTIRAAPAVVTALQGDTAALSDLARWTARNISLRSDPSLPPDSWVLEPAYG